MGKGCLAIPQEVGGLTRNSGVRVAGSEHTHMSRGEWNQNWPMCSGGIGEAYRDLAHIIHERFCYNRQSLTQARGARLAGKARQAETGLTRHASRASRAHCAIWRRTVRSKED